MRELAIEVRQWAERNHRRYASDMTLEGMCAITSAELYCRIKKTCSDRTHVKLGMAETRNAICHVAVIVDNAKLVDVTATQFSDCHKDVEIRPAKGMLYPWYWKFKHYFESDELLRMYQIRGNWVSWQVCELRGGNVKYG